MEHDTIAKRLTKFRTNRKLTQEQVAELIGKDLRTVQNHEKGANEPSGPVLKRYAQLYGVHWLEIKTGHAPPSGIVSDNPPLYGRSSEMVIEGKPIRVTEFGEGESGLAEKPIQSDLSRSVALLAELMQSRDPSFRAAIISNLEAFTSAAAKDEVIRRYEEEIKQLREKNTSLEERFAGVGQVMAKLEKIEKLFVDNYQPNEKRLIMKQLYGLMNGNTLLKRQWQKRPSPTSKPTGGKP